MKKIVIIFFLVFFLTALSVIWFRREDFKHIKRDWKIGVVTQDGLEMVMISPTRRMVNSIKIDKNVKVWIPGELGWIDQNRVKDVVEKSGDKKLIEKIFFYNFGFITDKVEYLNEPDDWNNNSELLKTMGLLSWLNFNYMRERVIFNDDVVSKDLLTLDSYFSDVMMRDFADTDLINEEGIKLTVVNSSQENGLAGFISSRLEWAGMSVVSSASEGKEMSEACLIALGPNTENSLTQKTLVNMLDCKKGRDLNLSDGEIELYFGENFAKVLKYSSYVRTF